MRTKKGDGNKLGVKRQLRKQMTPAELRLWHFLRFKQLEQMRFRRQHGIGPYVVDFFCPEKRLVVELDGDVHLKPQRQIMDREREGYLKKLGVRVLRYSNQQVIESIDGVLEDIRIKALTSPL